MPSSSSRSIATVLVGISAYVMVGPAMSQLRKGNPGTEDRGRPPGTGYDPGGGAVKEPGEDHPVPQS